MSWIDEVYDKEFANLLDEEPTLARSNTFRKVFEYLIGTDRKYYQIIETGSLRALDQWGDGQSTRLFDSFVNSSSFSSISLNILRI